MKRLVLEPEHEAFRETVRQFIERELVPNAEKWESDRLVDRSAFVAAERSAGRLLAVDRPHPETCVFSNP